jgi:hypothetical protein
MGRGWILLVRFGGIGPEYVDDLILDLTRSSRSDSKSGIRFLITHLAFAPSSPFETPRLTCTALCRLGRQDCQFDQSRGLCLQGCCGMPPCHG